MFLVRDCDYSYWDDKNKAVMKSYMKEAAAVLKEKISILEDFNQNFSIHDEASIKAILDSLLKNRKIWQEEFNQTNEQE
jgi:hypothetical protein